MSMSKGVIPTFEVHLRGFRKHSDAMVLIGGSDLSFSLSYAFPGEILETIRG